MSPREIVVGAIYRHLDHPGTVYLGCGDYWDGLPARRKFMIILKEDATPPNGFCAARVCSKRKDKYNSNWWSKFVLVKR